MNEIPSWFWMTIIAGLSGMFGMILFYTAMILKEGSLTMKEVRFVVRESRELVTSAKEALAKVNMILGTFKGTLEKISNYVIRPFQMINGFIEKIKSKVSGT